MAWNDGGWKQMNTDLTWNMGTGNTFTVRYHADNNRVNAVHRQARPGLLQPQAARAAHAELALDKDAIGILGGAGTWLQGPGRIGRAKQLGCISLGSDFAMSWDMTVASFGIGWRNILHVGNYKGWRKPAVWIYPHQLRLLMREDTARGNNRGCDPANGKLPSGKKVNIIMNCKGRSMTVKCDNKRVCAYNHPGNADGARQHGLLDVRPDMVFWMSDPWYNAAQATMANLKVAGGQDRQAPAEQAAARPRRQVLQGRRRQLQPTPGLGGVLGRKATVTRLDETVNYGSTGGNWYRLGGGWQNKFSVLWSGNVYTPQTGTYTFCTTARCCTSTASCW